MGVSGPQVDHVFVLMLENRSFDHMLAFAGLPGIARASATDANSFDGTTFHVGGPGAPWTMPTDPGHEFADAVEQLCGRGVAHEPWTAFPTHITNAGFVSNYATSRTEASPGSPLAPEPAEWGEIMRCFDTARQLPVLHQLASEFAVCDHWFSSIPGPTWPNRLFLHGASSAGWADSPTTDQLQDWIRKTTQFVFPSGASIFDRLREAGLAWRVYADEDGPALGGVPLVAALEGVVYRQNTFSLAQFDADLAGSYDYAYTFIEPNYGDVVSGSFAGGSSQHPMDGVTRGEALIKATYESIRRSPVWERSVLFVLYDEHGGFYDSVHPGPAPPPADGSPHEVGINRGGFLFDHYGVRVPAVVVSPLIPKGTVDATVYDHASVPATIERLFGLEPMTNRDRLANDICHLVSAPSPRTDCPTTLVSPAVTAEGAQHIQASPSPTDLAERGPAHIRLSVLLRRDLAGCVTDDERETIRREYLAIRTHDDARSYAAAAIARSWPR